MECHSSGKGKVPGSSGEPSSVADTYVVTTGGRRIKLKGAIEDTWSHGTPWGANGWKCGYCPAGQKSGGKTRLTEHLCAISGNVKSCSHVPPNVKTILLDQVALARQKKRDVKESRLYIEKALMEHDYRTTLASLDEDARYDMAVQNSLMDIGSTPKNRASGSGIYRAASPSGSSCSPLFHKGSAPSTGLSNLGKASSSGTKSTTLGKASSSGSGAADSTRQSSLHSFYQNPSSSKAPFDIDLARSKAPLQPRIDTMLSGDSALRLAKTWSKWFHANDVPGRKADCPYFRSAIKLTQQLGDVPIPKGKDIDGPLLEQNFNDLKDHMKSFREDWDRFGVTLMCDSWTSNNMMCIINFMIFCNGRMFFHKTVNATGEIQNAEFIYDCIIKVVEEEIGSKYIVQIVTDNGSNYKKACRMLVAKHKHITWQPCAAHTINLMLKDIGRFDEVDHVVKSAKRICNFFYNHNRLHAMMRQKIGGELVRWNATRFGTVFLCLQSFFDRQDEFKAWMVSPEWKNSEWRNDPDHEFAYDCLTNRVWWEKMELVLKVVGPLFCVLRYADQQKNGTISGFLPKMIQAYNEITGKIKQIKHGKGDFHKKVAEVISKRIRYLLNGTLIHAAAALDPSELYRSNLAKKSSSQFAVTMAIKKLAKSTTEAAAAIDQFSRFIEKRGLFGTPEARWSALNGRTSAAEWWGSYGGQYPELQRIARRIVSPCVSSSGCERNWSTFALVHTKIRNRLGYVKLEKLVYVHYNLKLCIQQFEADFENFREKDPDPCSMMMDLALYDEGNPIMEWLNNSMSESTPILDEYNDSDDDWSAPSNFVIETLHMDDEDVAAFKRKMQLGKKKKRKMQLDEDDQYIADDYDTSSEEHGSPVYAESGDSSSNDEDDGDNDVGDGSGGTTAGTDVPGASGVNHGEPTPLRPRSTRKRKPNVKSIYIL